mgnify:CR=1 FL=1
MGNYTGTTIAFSHKGGFWKTRYSYTPTCYAAVDNVMISNNKTPSTDYTNQNALFWEHEVNVTHNSFYGKVEKSTLTVVSNQDPSAVKLFKALSLESNSNSWTGRAATNINPAGSPQNELQSGLINGFITKEGNQYSELPKSLNNSNSNLDYVCEISTIVDISLLSSVLGDLDSTGEVVVADLLLLLSEFGTVGEELSADLNLDGSVSVTDLLLLLSNFGQNVAGVTLDQLFFSLNVILNNGASIIGTGWSAPVLSSSFNTPLLGGSGSKAVFVNSLGVAYTLNLIGEEWVFTVLDLTTPQPFIVNDPSTVYIHSYNSDGSISLGIGGNLTLAEFTALINFTNSLGSEWNTIQLYSVTSPAINGDPMRGQYIRLHLENTSTTPVETYAINVDFENTKLDGSKGSIQKKPKQKASPSSK